MPRLDSLGRNGKQASKTDSNESASELSLWEYNIGEGEWMEFEEGVQVQINDALMASMETLTIGGGDGCVLDLVAGELIRDGGETQSIRRSGDPLPGQLASKVTQNGEGTQVRAAKDFEQPPPPPSDVQASASPPIPPQQEAEGQYATDSGGEEEYDDEEGDVVTPMQPKESTDKNKKKNRRASAPPGMVVSYADETPAPDRSKSASKSTPDSSGVFDRLYSTAENTRKRIQRRRRQQEEEANEAANSKPNFSGQSSTRRDFDARHHGDGRGLQLFDDSDDESIASSHRSMRAKKNASQQSSAMNRLSSSYRDSKESSTAEAEKQLYSECTFQPNTSRSSTPMRRISRSRRKKRQDQVFERLHEQTTTGKAVHHEQHTFAPAINKKSQKICQRRGLGPNATPGFDAFTRLSTGKRVLQ
jgi:hypothetical protein